MSEESPSENERQISVPIPLDAERFVLRECPACEREFRWRVADEDEPFEPVPEGGYHCPYCDARAPSQEWFTKAQAEFVSASALHSFAPGLDQAFAGLERNSGSLRIEVSGSLDPGEPEPLREDLEADARRVEFACHPIEPIKVDPDWQGPLHCLICGETAERQ